MMDRRSTPEILAALGAMPKEKPPVESTRNPQSQKTASTGKKGEDSTVELDALLQEATQSVIALGKAMGRDKLIHWLDQLRDTFISSTENGLLGIPSQADIASWARGHLGATSTAPNYLVYGQLGEHPYEVDIWARFKNGFPQGRMDMWIECWDEKAPVKRRDVQALIRKAVDVFYAAHAERQDFWFDRLMLVSASSFDPKAITLAEQYGVSCVSFDGAGFSFQTRNDWRVKPKWLEDAEAALEKLQG